MSAEEYEYKIKNVEVLDGSRTVHSVYRTDTNGWTERKWEREKQVKAK